MKIPIVLIIGISFLTSSYSIAQDSLKSQLKFTSFLCGDVSSIGFYGGVGAQIQRDNITFSLSYLVDYSKADFPVDGPFGIGISISYFPNHIDKKIIKQYLNTDYRLIFHKRYCIYDCSKKYNKTNEISIGYGISIKVFKKLSISNSINVGWYIENLYSDRTSKTIINSGVNTLVQTRINFHF